MAELKKYLDTTALGALVDQIKAEDAKVLQGAKGYADGLATNYDAAGSAAGALTSAKAYTDELANGQVKTNKEDIAKLNGDASTEGSVAKAVADSAATLQANIDTVDGKADQNAEDIAALETLVGELPEGTTATSVVDYVNKKTEGIATDAALGELNSQVSGLQTAVQGIQNDYLKEEDKTELNDLITAESETARAAEKANADAIKAIQDDYLVEADKTELQGNIDAVSAKVTTLIGEDADKSVRAIANEELAKQLIADGAAESLDTLAEIAAWIQEHPEDASAMNKAIEDLEALVGTIPEGVTATTIVGYIAEVQAAVDAEVSARETADGELDTRLKAVESAVGDSGSVATDISTAKQEAIDAAAEDATTKAGQALTDAKAYTDTEVGKDRARLDALEAIEHHDHSNKTVLDGITEAKVTSWDAASTKAHEHSNKTVLDGITAENVTTWNTVTSKATQTDLDNAVARIAVNEGAIGTINTTLADKAEQDDLDAAVERIAANETAIAANTSAINSFTAITADEVNALFA